MNFDKDVLKSIIVSKMYSPTEPKIVIKKCKLIDYDSDIGCIGEHIECLCSHTGKTFKCYVRKDVYNNKINEQNAVIFEDTI